MRACGNFSGVCLTMTMESKEAERAGRHPQAERRIAWLTLTLGLGASVVVATFVSRRFGVGVALGAVLAWVNFRWLQGALDALAVLSSAQARAEKPRISLWAFTKLFARYALIAVILYVMVTRFGIPLLSLLVGLCALGAATIAGSIYEVIHGPE